VPVRTDRTKARWYRRDGVRRLRLRLPCAAISAVTRRIRKAGLRLSLHTSALDRVATAETAVAGGRPATGTSAVTGGSPRPRWACGRGATV